MVIDFFGSTPSTSQAPNMTVLADGVALSRNIENIGLVILPNFIIYYTKLNYPSDAVYTFVIGSKPITPLNAVSYI